MLDLINNCGEIRYLVQLTKCYNKTYFRMSFGYLKKQILCIKLCIYICVYMSVCVCVCVLVEGWGGGGVGFSIERLTQLLSAQEYVYLPMITLWVTWANDTSKLTYSKCCHQILINFKACSCSCCVTKVFMHKSSDKCHKR